MFIFLLLVTLLEDVRTKPKWRKYSFIRKKVTFFDDRLAHAKPLMLDMNALNVYQINTYKKFTLLYKAHRCTTPSIFFNKFSKINHNYSTSSKNSGNYTIPKLTMKLTNRSNPLEYSFRCNAQRNRIFTNVQSKSQRNAPPTWQRAFVLLMIVNLMFF